MTVLSKKFWLVVGLVGAVVVLGALGFFLYKKIHPILTTENVTHSPSSLIISYRDHVQNWKKNLDEAGSVQSVATAIEQEMLTVHVPREFLDDHVKVVSGFHNLNNVSPETILFPADYLNILNPLLNAVNNYKI